MVEERVKLILSSCNLARTIGAETGAEQERCACTTSDQPCRRMAYRPLSKLSFTARAASGDPVKNANASVSDLAGSVMDVAVIVGTLAGAVGTFEGGE